ncbi:MAG: DUF3084 domain-containing protein [bacterium]
MAYGILLIIILVLLGGAIAYIGDRVGQRVGKRRISLMGLRPKHTSIIVTIITGFLITGITFGALFAMSAWVREAFFGLERLRNDLKVTKVRYMEVKRQHSGMQNKLKEIREQISRTEKQIAEKTDEIDRLKDKAKETKENVAELEGQRDELLEAKAELEQKKAQLEKEVEETALRLGQASKTCLYGEVIFKRDQALARLAIPGGASGEVVKKQLDTVTEQLYQAAEKRGAIMEEGFGTLFEYQKKELMKTLADMDAGAVLEILSATNVLDGEPLIIRLVIVENRLVIEKGEVLEKVLIEAGSDGSEVERSLEKAMRAVSELAHGKGIVPDMETGEVPVVSARKLPDVSKRLAGADGDVEVAIVAARDTRIADQLEVDFRVKQK